jgi:hypothetical protein
MLGVFCQREIATGGDDAVPPRTGTITFRPDERHLRRDYRVRGLNGDDCLVAVA